MANVLMGLQIVLSIILVASILPQGSKSAVPTEFGGEGTQSYFKPKGKEAFLGRVTKISAVLFFLKCTSFSYY